MNIEQVFSEADPARNVTEDELASSRRRALSQAAPKGITQVLNSGTVITEPAPKQPTTTTGRAFTSPPRVRFARLVAAGAAFAILLTVIVVSIVVPRTAPSPADDGAAVARLFDEAESVVGGTPLSSNGQGSVDAGELRFQLLVDIEQVFKGSVPEGEVLIDVTGHPVASFDTLEEARTSFLFKRSHLLFLDAKNKVIDNPLAILTVTNKRTGTVSDSEGTPIALPEELGAQLNLLPQGEVPLETSDREAGQVSAETVLGVIPEVTPGTDASETEAVLGTIHGEVREGGACFWYEYEGESWYLRWPEAFTADTMDLSGTYLGDGPTPLVLNEAGYPYVFDGHGIPYLRGSFNPGEELTCGGRTMQVFDVAIEPGSTLLEN